MYQKIYPFGEHVFGENLGEIWLSLVRAILQEGTYSEDEGRKRIALQEVVLKSHSQDIPDQLILKYGKKKNLDNLLKLTFDEGTMFDFDVNPSFPKGAKSYHQRIVDGKMLEFVVKRLTKYPESKKAVIVFPTYQDYKAVLDAPDADYLPCLVSVQFRIVVKNGKYVMNTISNFRSIDAHQKAYANFWAVAKMTEMVCEELEKNLNRSVTSGSFTAMISDAHIYEETETDARRLVEDSGEEVCKY